jgi:hypothetical protein
MTVPAQVKFAIDLTEQEYALIRALRERPELSQKVNALIARPATAAAAGIDSQELLSFLTDWREELTAEDIISFRESLAFLRQEEEETDAPPSSF